MYIHTHTHTCVPKNIYIHTQIHIHTYRSKRRTCVYYVSSYYICVLLLYMCPLYYTLGVHASTMCPLTTIYVSSLLPVQVEEGKLGAYDICVLLQYRCPLTIYVSSLLPVQVEEGKLVKDTYTPYIRHTYAIYTPYIRHTYAIYTYRWRRGSSVPTRSCCCYICVLFTTCVTIYVSALLPV